ncbi:MAG: DUF1624 domain-containing protein [bacterium]|nr:DUF1624 domain-containing protein [bacterium]
MVDRSVDDRSVRQQRHFVLDAFRGLIIILMALDHANYFVAQRHSSGEHWGGPFPVYGDALSFVTRLVTHPVAPGFSFLMGVGMALFASSRRARGWSDRAIVKHFVIRGTVLIALQLTIVNLAWQTGPRPNPTIYLGVLFALGGGMILGSVFIRVSPRYLLAFAALLFVAVEMTHPKPEQWGLNFDQPLGLIFGFSGGSDFFWSNYPILGWLELVILGLAFGKLITVDSTRILRVGAFAGAAFLLGFVVLRGADGFGNIRPRPSDDWIGFLNVVKYPPAMTFTLLTMGANLMLLGLLAHVADTGRRVLRPLTVFGRVPLFFYLAHLYLYSAIGAIFTPTGSSLPAMYVYWIAGLAALYPACHWYGNFKRRRPDSLLRFL